MIDKRNSRISLATLILCLCLGSLVILPFIQINPSAPEFSTMDVSNLFEHTEFDDDFFAVSIVGVKIAKPNYSKSRTANLGYLSASLAPVSPPPKHS
jgi:hypothetical protein